MDVLDDFRLDRQVAIVTGAGAGIGRSIAEIFATAGAAVLVSDLKEATAAEVAEHICDSGGRAVHVACDVTNEQDRTRLVGTAREALGSVTILVNNAGGGGPKPFDMPLEDFVWAYELNVFSTFRLCQLCAPLMEEAGGGAILNISSMPGRTRTAE